MDFDEIIRLLIPDVEFHQNRYARALDDVVLQGGRWLDLGAGTRIHGGWNAASNETLVSRSEIVVGCDLLREHLIANRHLGAGVAASGECLPFRSASFDLVTANMVVEHLRDPLVVFVEAHRVLEKGGRFVLVTPNRHHPGVSVASSIPPKWRALWARGVEGRHEEDIFRTFYRANTRKALRRLGEGAGFRVEHLEAFPSYPMFRRPWPLTFAEVIWIRIVGSRIGEFASNLIAAYVKPDSAPVDGPRRAMTRTSTVGTRHPTEARHRR